MVYIGKVAFNIDGITIYLGPSLPSNYKHLQSLLAKMFDSLLKTYDELQLLVLNEISLIGCRIFFLLTFILNPSNIHIIIYLEIWMS
jgi:hypothetical protein